VRFPGKRTGEETDSNQHRESFEEIAMIGSRMGDNRNAGVVDMNNTRVAPGGVAPWHLWLVAVLMFVWNSLSCYSYVMTLSQNEAFFRAGGITPEIAAYFAALPAWYVVAWTIGVWGGAFAALGLLMRKSWAVWLFAVSQMAMAINSVAIQPVAGVAQSKLR